MKTIIRKGWASTAPLLTASVLALIALPASAATFWFSDTPYTSTADIPAGFYASGSWDFLEDFEDGSLDGGITAASTLSEIRNGTPTSDSVDSVEYPGSNGTGTSFLTRSVTFTFLSPVTAAGLVWTDGVGDFAFEAFNELGASLGSIERSLGVANSFQGGNDEDRFFGVTSLGGIKSISMTWIGNDRATMELDHIQYGVAVIPVPAGLPLLLAGLGALGLVKRAKRA